MVNQVDFVLLISTRLGDSKSFTFRLYARSTRAHVSVCVRVRFSFSAHDYLRRMHANCVMVHTSFLAQVLLGRSHLSQVTFKPAHGDAHIYMRLLLLIIMYHFCRISDL